MRVSRNIPDSHLTQKSTNFYLEVIWNPKTTVSLVSDEMEVLMFVHTDFETYKLS